MYDNTTVLYNTTNQINEEANPVAACCLLSGVVIVGLPILVYGIVRDVLKRYRDR